MLSSPWRRGAPCAAKTLSVEAAEFVPRGALEAASSADGTPVVAPDSALKALQSNVCLFNLDGYSDEEDEDEEEITPMTPPTGPVAENAKDEKKESRLEERGPAAAPWRSSKKEVLKETRGGTTKTAEVVPVWRRGRNVPKTTAGDDEQEPFSTPTAAALAQSKPPPWRRNAGKLEKSNTQPSPVEAPHTIIENATHSSLSPKKDTSSTTRGSPSSASTQSSAGASAADSDSTVSLSPEPETKEEIEDLEAKALDCDASGESEGEFKASFALEQLLRWKHASSTSSSMSSVRSEATEVILDHYGNSLVYDVVDCRECGNSTFTSPAQTPQSRTTTPKVTPKVRGRGQAKSFSSDKDLKWSTSLDKKLESGENSWATMQKLRKQSSVGDDQPSDEEVVRKMKSILNKLTLEKFSELYRQLVSCGITSSLHVELLIREVFEKATTQHHFIDMYADLCARLEDYFMENPIGSDAGKNDFKRILLNECQGSFERHLAPPADLGSLSGEDRMLAEVKYKTRMLGNIRFVGALLARRMLASKVLLAVVEELLGDPTSEALESLSALLTVVGPTFDTPDWAYHLALNAIFDQVLALTKKNTVEQRIRCILKDVLELREAGWQSSKPKKIDGPSTIDQVHEKAHCEGLTPSSKKEHGGWEQASPGGRHSKPQLPASPCNRRTSASSSEKCFHNGWQNGAGGPDTRRYLKSEALERLEQAEQQRKAERLAAKEVGKAEKLATRAAAKAKQQEEEEEESWDQEAYRREVERTFSELRVSHDVEEAALRLANARCPVSQQPLELQRLLSDIVQEGSVNVRQNGFATVSRLFLAKAWPAPSLNAGLQLFLEETCQDLKHDVPDLPQILKDELHPALSVLAREGLVEAVRHASLLSF